MALAMVAETQTWDRRRYQPPPAASGPRPRRLPSARVVRRRRALAGGVATISVLVGGWVLGHGTPLRPGTAGGAAGGGPLTATGSPTLAPGSPIRFRAAGSAGVLSARPASAQVWVVRPGDTLWSIVVDSGYPGDPRPLVDELQAQLGGRPLSPGERLLLP